MNDTDRYLFDLQGYLHLPGFLTTEETTSLLAAAKELEAAALAVRSTAPRFRSRWGKEYWQHPEDGWFAAGTDNPGDTLMVEDFWLHGTGFDRLIGQEATMAYIRRIIQSPIRINNSELRIRYSGNHTSMHMGFPAGHSSKYAYRVVDDEVDCMMVRMVYFLHDVPLRGGPMCFIPGSHKGAFPLPEKTADPIDEPGVVGVPVRGGDAILFTENCRHGGLTNYLQTTRYTLHVGYGPEFLPSQNISTMDEPPNVTPALRARLSAEQLALFEGTKRREPLGS